LCTNAEVFAVLGNYEKYPEEPALDAVLCSHAALSCFMKARTLEDAILLAINLGGDADTVGACCGALAGACWGSLSIPERWKQEIESYKTILHSAELLWEYAEHS
jgi:ADP-ribosyl-[dinitrogen reductase] hydrolase